MMKEEYGTIMVKCDPSLYGNDRLELGYWLYSEKDEDFSQDLAFIQNNYREMYEQLLSDLHSAYRKNPQWDVWIKETKDFSRMEFIQKEELHPYLGLPTICLQKYRNRVYWGLSFFRDNCLSIEHGFCAVFCQDQLLLLCDSDFSNIMNYWKFYFKHANILEKEVLETYKLF